MDDLHRRLDRLGGSVVTPTVATVNADLSRGRRALRRRRVGQTVAGTAFVAFAALAAASVIPAGFATDADPAPIAGANSASGVPARLVSYTGKQPVGFTLDKVPEGWELQGSDRYGMTLAPAGTGAKPPIPSQAPSSGVADQDPHNFVGKVAVMLVGGLPGVACKDVRVNDKDGKLCTMKGDRDGVPGSIFVKQPSGAYLYIQVWEGLKWGEKDIVAFAAGVQVLPDAGLVVG